MHREVFFGDLCFLHLSSFFRLVAAPSPPLSSPHWLEAFLAMNWRDTVDFSQQLDEDGSSHPAGVSGATDAMSSTVRGDPSNRPPALAVQGAVYPGFPFSFPSRIASIIVLPVQLNVQAQRAATFRNADTGWYSSSNVFDMRTSRSSREASAGPSIREVSERLGGFQTQTLATLSDIIHLPITYTWLPSHTLLVEMEQYVVRLDARLQGEMFRVTSLVDSEHNGMPSHSMFLGQSKVYAIQLPSRIVFVKLFKPNRFDSTSPTQRTTMNTLTIWSLDLGDSQFPLALRGVWSITSGVQRKVTESLLAVKYLVRQKQDVRGAWEKFLERDDVSPAPDKHSTFG
ncbi:uncharacterized protein SPSC_03538 [Sporisorium scitamineum]|uniref:Uncharacterized protein n=2 Tax=Sporisorium scitamineum TaxID=49012 RepID=A0A140KN47_9BASI|nr:uncharacterized protein SPSC_03538 [Sporisorium scitamineum]